MTDIQRCEVRPGRVVEWTLHPSSVEAAAGLPEDSRPPAYVQESHVRTARSVRDGGLSVPTWLGAAFDLAGPVDTAALQQALTAWTLRHETLRSGLRWVDGELRRFTLAAADVALHREEVGGFTDAAVLTRYLQDRFDTAANALSWPNFIFTAVLRESGASVYAAFDHSNVDAYSLYRLPAEIHDLYEAARAGRPDPTPPVASYVDFCAVERDSADRIDDTHAIVARWRAFLAQCDGTLPNFPIDLGLTPGGPLPTQKLLRAPLADDADAAAFEAYCRPYGGSLVGMLAATALVLHEMGGQPVYRAVVPFHTRVKSQWQDSLGWYVGGAPIEVPLARAPDFDSALRLVRDELRRNRPLSRIPIARVLHQLGTDFRPTSPDLYAIVSYVDTRGIPGSERWPDMRAHGLVRVSYGDKVCAWIARFHDGLHFSARHPDTDTAHKNMRRYVEGVRERITATARAVSARAASGAG
ncbi:condensation domain-containing protein [Streptomyces sp. G45]|uniref:condensation domain-containing protein n=1 Tax=Streptomyces sp. G45 TaxID=3406627 RepID=UPI003C18B3F6